ncbi:hypothetical protein IGB42_03608 [Andreprevotia sp. IGB-42]|nr:hypothetical protein IGB42_03608 [Andreprevotia sp. IGB-42]
MPLFGSTDFLLASTAIPVMAKQAMHPVLIIPGIGGSGAGHWQSRWQAFHPSCSRVEQADWDHPLLAAWLARLDAAIVASGPDTLLAAHSLGCLLVAHWAASTPRPIRGALLVAVPDPAGPAFPAEAASFGPTPANRLPFPATLVASTDDPYGSLDHASATATNWGANFVNAGAHGHLNAASGLGDWPAGWQLLQQFSAPDTAP